MTRLANLVRLAEEEESRQARVPSARHDLPTIRGTRTHTNHRLDTQVYTTGVEGFTVRARTSGRHHGHGLGPSRSTQGTEPSIPFRNPSSAFRPPVEFSYTDTAQRVSYVQRPRRAYYTDTVQPSEAGPNPHREARRNTLGYQSTSSQAPPGPWTPSQQPPDTHYKRGRPRTREPDLSRPSRKSPSSVIQPACVSEPDTEIDDPFLRPQNEVKMLPTPAGSVHSRVGPPPTKHTRDSHRNVRSAQHAYETDRNTSPEGRWNPATQSSKPGGSTRPQKKATQTQHSVWPTLAPLGNSTDPAQNSHTQPTEAHFRESVESGNWSSQAQQPSLPTEPSYRRALPKTWDEYYDTSPSMVNGRRKLPAEEVAKAKQYKPKQTKSPAVTAKTNTARTEKTTRTTDTTQTPPITHTAKSPTSARSRPGPRLGANIGSDPRDRF